MPFSTMAAIMLLIALVSGLADGVPESFRAGRFHLFAVIVLAGVLRIARLELAPEFSANLGCLFYVSALFLAAFVRCRRSVFRVLLLAILLSVPILIAQSLLGGDAAILLSALFAALALPAAGDIPSALAAAAIAPVFAAADDLLLGLMTVGYGVFELGEAYLDVQLTGAVLIVFFISLARFNRCGLPDNV